MSVGDEVTVGHGAILHGCTIKDRCLIGTGAVVLDGAVIESDVILGAGSLVPSKAVLKSGFVYIGSPRRNKLELSPMKIVNSSNTVLKIIYYLKSVYG